MDERRFDTWTRWAVAPSRRRLLGGGLLLAAAALAGGADAKGSPRPARRWAAAWRAWFTANPGAAERCGLGQRDRVWFLPGIPTDADLPVLRVACVVPTGTPLFVPLLIGDAPTAGACEAGVAGVLADTPGGIDALSLTVDGRDVGSLAPYRFAPTAGGEGAVCGYALLLRPLPPGEHVVRFAVVGTPVELVWTVTAVPRGRLRRGD
jgi:hypothetical protein